MKALQLREPQHFQVIDVPEPEAPAPDEAIVRVHRVGICGTDLSGYLGKMPFFSYPRIPGHELGVEVVDIGKNVTHITKGDYCSVEPYINNPQSDASQRGYTNCCNDMQVLGVHIDGGMRPYFKLPARKLHPAKSLQPDQLALVETLAIGCHAVNRGGPQKGEQVLVIGAGPIGLSVLEFLRIIEAEVTVLDLSEARLAFCRDKLHVAHTITMKNDGSELQQMQDITKGAMYRLVVDATGHNGSMSHCLEYASHAGRVVYVGITTQEVHFAHPLMHRKELTLLASRNAVANDFKRIIRLIEEKVIDTRPWITHHLKFDDVPTEFVKFTRPETGAIKAIIEL